MRASFLRHFGTAVRPACLAGAVCATVFLTNDRQSNVALSDRSPELHKRIIDTAARMGKYTHTNSDLLRLSKEKNAVKIYYVKEGKIPGGLGVARVAEVEINAPIDQVAELWWHQGLRKEWDVANTDDSQNVRDLDADTKICYIRSKPKAMLAARDFGFFVCRVPASVVGHPFNSQVFVQVDAADEVPKDNACVRANVNSMIVLTPITASRTKATYCCEMNVNGWVPSSVMDMNADDVPMVVGVVKRTLESETALEDAAQDIETAARIRFEHSRKMNENERSHGPSVIDDVTATRHDLEAIVATLEQRYKALTSDERATGNDYGELKQRIQTDISRAKQRIRRM